MSKDFDLPAEKLAAANKKSAEHIDEYTEIVYDSHVVSDD